MEAVHDLETLLAKMNTEIAAKDRELASLKEKRDTIQNALRILEQAGFAKQESLPINAEKSQPKSNEYAKKGMRESISDMLSAVNGGIGLTSRDIYHKLMAGGYTSDSKDKMRDVLVALNRMEKKGDLTHERKDNKKHYKIQKVRDG